MLDTVTYYSFVKPLVRARRIDDARLVFADMVQKVSHHQLGLIMYHLASLRLVKRYLILGKMKETCCHPINDTSIMLIREFCRWLFENVFLLWNEMDKNGVKLKLVLFSF